MGKSSLFLLLILTTAVAMTGGVMISKEAVAKSVDRVTPKMEQTRGAMDCRYVKSIEDGFLSYHVKYSSRDQDLQKRVVEQYLKHIDPSKIYLVESDVAEVESKMGDVFKKTAAQNCSFFLEVHKILIKKAQERVDFVKKFLGPSYKFDDKAEFVYEPDKKPWAKSSKELDEYIKKYVHFQVANYRATGSKMPEAKKNVIKIYERSVKKLKDEKMSDLLNDYLDSFARSLDPHSSFFSKDVLDDFDIQMKLSLEGIGATLSFQDGFTVVEALVPGGAAARSGYVEPQDKIIAVGQDSSLENVSGLSLSDLQAKLKGAPDSTVRLSLSRQEGSKSKQFEATVKRNKEGEIGITFKTNEEGKIIVDQVDPKSVNKKEGLIKANDVLIASGEELTPMENVIDMDLKDVVKKIRGPKGTKVRLNILRKKGDKKSLIEVTLTRDKVNLEDEAASIVYVDREVNGKKKKVGVINFPSFYSDAKKGGKSSAQDLKNILKDANEKKADALVLDLSTNGGGSLDDAVKIAGLFYQTGNVVKSSSKIDAGGNTILKDTDPTVDWTGPLVLLTSRVSASASEIVAGTLQDYKRAVVVGGDHTFGKGSIQSVLPIPSELGAIKVTVGMFFVAGGNSTQHRGVDGDIVLPSVLNSEDIGEKYLEYSLPPKKIDSFISKTAFVKEGAGAWAEIQPDWLPILREKSRSRVEKNEEFKKINDDISKAKSRGKLIKVAEILKEKNEKDKKAKAIRTASKEEKNKEYLKRPDIQEAVNVVLDLYDLESGQVKSK